MAQFPFDVLDVDWPRPRLVRCVSCVMTVVLATGAFGDADVGADAEADAEVATVGGAASEPE
jgi:hypothetical protein